MPSSGIAGLNGSFIPRFLPFFLFLFLRNLHTVLHRVVSACSPTNSVTGFPFSTSSLAFIVCRLSDDHHSHQRDTIPHCGVNLHFFNYE